MQPLLISVIVLYGCVALALAATLLFFVNVKRELNRKLKTFEEALRLVQERGAKPPEPEPIRVPVTVPVALNQNRRVQALRLLRRGEDAGHVAAAVDLPRSHVELLAKVQEMAARS